jgi:hypothetical protein
VPNAVAENVTGASTKRIRPARAKRVNMRINIPWHDLYPQYHLVAKTPAGDVEATVDNTHSFVEIALPPGVEKADVEVVGCPVGNNGQPIGGVSLIQARVERPKPAPRSAPRPVRKPEPRPEPQPEPAIESGAKPEPAIDPPTVLESDHSET